MELARCRAPGAGSEPTFLCLKRCVKCWSTQGLSSLRKIASSLVGQKHDLGIFRIPLPSDGGFQSQHEHRKTLCLHLHSIPSKLLPQPAMMQMADSAQGSAANLAQRSLASSSQPWGSWKTTMLPSCKELQGTSINQGFKNMGKYRGIFHLNILNDSRRISVADGGRRNISKWMAANQLRSRRTLDSAEFHARLEARTGNSGAPKEIPDYRYLRYLNRQDSSAKNFPSRPFMFLF